MKRTFLPVKLPIVGWVLISALNAWAIVKGSFVGNGITWNYKITDTFVEVGCPSASGNIEIPGEITHGGKSYRVTRIGRCSTEGGRITGVTIPDGITEIGDSAFRSCWNLYEVSIPGSVTKIGDKAFYECSALCEVSIPEGVTEIGRSAFYSCRALREVSIPGSVTMIGDRAFAGCALEEISLPEGVKEIGAGAFADCSYLYDVVFPDSVEVLGDGAFDRCSNLDLFDEDGFAILGNKFLIGYDEDYDCNIEDSEHVSITIPGGIVSIDSYAFAKHPNIVSVSIPSSVRNIGEGAFYKCPGLADENGFVIVEGVMYGYYGNATTVTVPAGVKSIFSFVDNPDNCTAKTVVLPEGLLRIEEDAFYECSSITKVNIPSSVMHIGSGAFGSCARVLFDLNTIRGIKVLDGWAYGVPYSDSDTFTLGTLNLKGMRGIKEGAFSEEHIAEVIIPGTVKIIPKSAFWDVYTLTRATLQEGIVSIEAEAFSETGLTSITIPNSVTNIGEEAFSYTDLQSVTIPRRVKSIGACAFANCEYLTTARIPSTLRGKIPDNVFRDCDDVRIEYYDVAGVSPYVELVVAPGCEAMGTATGGNKEFSPGTKASLKATAKSGHVFAGWYEDGKLLSRGASFSYVVPTNDVCIEARFATAADDKASLAVNVAPSYELGEDMAFNLDLKDLVTSLSDPKLTVKGLPSGIKYDAKTGLISGRTVNPGVYKVTVSATNSSVTQPKTVVFELKVPNLSWSDEELKEAMDNLQDTYDVEVGLAPTLFDLAKVIGSGWKIAVAGLPAGLKWDAKYNVVTGVPTKPGEYTVKLTAKKLKTTEVATVSLRVAALPDGVVGIFNGFVKASDGEENLGTIQLTATDVGKLAAKVATPDGSYSFSRASWDGVENGVYRATLLTKKGDSLTFSIDSTAGWNTSQLSGTFTASGSEAHEITARKNAFVNNKWAFNATGNEVDGWTLSFAPNEKSADLTVTMKADGSTAIAGKLGVLKVTASGYADVTGLTAGAICADFVPVISMKEDKVTVKRALSIRLNLWFDRSDEHAEGVGSARFVK